MRTFLTLENFELSVTHEPITHEPGTTVRKIENNLYFFTKKEKLFLIWVWNTHLKTVLRDYIYRVCVRTGIEHLMRDYENTITFRVTHEPYKNCI